MVRSLRERTGIYGKAKLRAFAVLENRDWMTSRELILLSGLPYHSISKLLSKWVGFGYLERHLSYKFGTGDYEYRLLSRGRDWLEVARRDLPAAKRFEAELRQWQVTIMPRLKILLDGKFKDVLAILEVKHG